MLPLRSMTIRRSDARLAELDSMTALALRFAILTAARAGEVTGARWSEFDIEAKVWTVPSDRIKAGRTHRVPLSHDAMEILAWVRTMATAALVFPGWVAGRPLSLASMLRSKAGRGGDATVHGFRSTFRDWASEHTNYPRDVAEMALAHSIGDRVEAAYRRGDLFERRKLMMEDWATFVRTPPSTKVMPIGNRRRVIWQPLLSARPLGGWPASCHSRTPRPLSLRLHRGGAR